MLAKYVDQLFLQYQRLHNAYDEVTTRQEIPPGRNTKLFCFLTITALIHYPPRP